jgi:hypothetical protein
LAFFLKNQCYDQIFLNSSSLSKNANIFGENIFKIITSVPDWANFRLFWRLINLDSVLKITEVAQIFWLHFSTVPGYVLVLTNNQLGYRLGYFFTNSYGHPGPG